MYFPRVPIPTCRSELMLLQHEMDKSYSERNKAALNKLTELKDMALREAEGRWVQERNGLSQQVNTVKRHTYSTYIINLHVHVHTIESLRIIVQHTAGEAATERSSGTEAFLGSISTTS